MARNLKLFSCLVFAVIMAGCSVSAFVGRQRLRFLSLGRSQASKGGSNANSKLLISMMVGGKNVQRDDNGYEIKPKDWFNGLSLDPGGSLTDPRAVPPEAREFAEQIKSGSIEMIYQGSIDMINKHYNYFEVCFSIRQISYLSFNFHSN